MNIMLNDLILYQNRAKEKKDNLILIQNLPNIGIIIPFGSSIKYYFMSFSDFAATFREHRCQNKNCRRKKLEK